jgi:serine protease AprX
MAAVSFSFRFSFQQARRQARDLHRSLLKSDPQAQRRLEAHHPERLSSNQTQLADAQLIVAREHGFASWSKLKDYARSESRSQAKYIDTLKWVSSRYEIPGKLTDEAIQSICSKPGSIESIWGFCGKDISGSDFSEASPEDLAEVAFDRFTTWPASLPKYDYPSVLREGKSPGLSLSRLHRKGTDGSGIAIAVIDKPILATHAEFRDCLVNYVNVVEDHDDNDQRHFHGMSCAGFACGRTVGVAPGARLHYYAWPDRFDNEVAFWDYHYAALDRVVEHNQVSDEKIRVVSISSGFSSSQQELKERLDSYGSQLAEDGCHVIYSNVFGQAFTSASREYGTDADDENGYRLDAWQTSPNGIGWHSAKVLTPSGGRTSPCNSGADAYMYTGNQNSYSYAIPYVAGVFALALQVDGKLSYQEFSRLAQETAKRNNLGLSVLNPVALIDRVSSGPRMQQ